MASPPKKRQRTSHSPLVSDSDEEDIFAIAHIRKLLREHQRETDEYRCSQDARMREIEKWIGKSEKRLVEGRQRKLERMELEEREALEELANGFMRSPERSESFPSPPTSMRPFQPHRQTSHTLSLPTQESPLKHRTPITAATSSSSSSSTYESSDDETEIPPKRRPKPSVSFDSTSTGTLHPFSPPPQYKTPIKPSAPPPPPPSTARSLRERKPVQYDVKQIYKEKLGGDGDSQPLVDDGGDDGGEYIPGDVQPGTMGRKRRKREREGVKREDVVTPDESNRRKESFMSPKDAGSFLGKMTAQRTLLDWGVVPKGGRG